MNSLNGNIKNVTEIQRINPNSYGFFHVSNTTKKSKTIEFFEDLYTYPPKFKVKWNALDDLNEDQLSDSKSNKNSSQANITHQKNPKSNRYTIEDYLKGYKNKITSQNFYNNKTKKLQQAIQNIPVYVILNSRNEIVLANSTKRTTERNNPIQNFYNICGNFDSLDNGNSNFGFFFMAREDAEVYLTEIAQADTEGLKMFGLSIHCIGLDIAYKITHEIQPNVDFRFIPDLSEVQTLLKKSTGNSNFIFEDAQQQIRLRPRLLKLLPQVGKINSPIPPFVSFVEKNAYFKGVPIYIVQTDKNPSSFLNERYTQTVNFIDIASARILNTINFVFGFGQNWILQKSIQNNEHFKNLTSYVFFDQETALKFCAKYSREIKRYKGSFNAPFDSFASQPKILIYNLEDFFELWENSTINMQNSKSLSTFVENLTLNIDEKEIYFIPSQKPQTDITTYLNKPNKRPLDSITNFLYFKYRRLIGFTEIFLNTN